MGCSWLLVVAVRDPRLWFLRLVLTHSCRAKKIVEPTVASKQTGQRVAFQELESARVTDSELAVSATPTGHFEPIVTAAFRSNSRPILLSELEQIALTINPAIAEIEAEIESLRGKAVQASLPPNPRVGVNAEDIFEEGNGGAIWCVFRTRGSPRE